MPLLFERDKSLVWRENDQVLLIEAWGENSLRVRSALGEPTDALPAALLPRTSSAPSAIHVDEQAGSIATGNLRATVIRDTGEVTFSRGDTGDVLLSEGPGHPPWPFARRFTAQGAGTYQIDQRFAAHPDEMFFGLGQHPHGLFDQKGTVTELVQRNSEVSVPFLLSSRGYGFLWNSPAVGRVELASNGTRWTSDRARQIDYWVTAADEPLAILRQYADATGHAPEMPEWATGFWQSKLRYTSQEELLEVAREYHRRGIPLAVIVADYFHWTHLGDWRFDPVAWPDPAAMVDELERYGTRLIVSAWPSASPLSENYDEMQVRGYLVRTERGTPIHHLFPDWGFGSTPQGVSFYDPTNPAAREFVWNAVRENYLSAGVGGWWLDGSEPEIDPEGFSNLRFTAGPGQEVANVYPREHARTFFEGTRADAGETPVLLIRSAWAGSQQYGALLWSGDIAATWESLAQQVTAGLNVAVSGIPWWTTDIGGFHGGDPDDEAYRELYVRWFQFGVFSPVTRAHGNREPRGEFVVGHTGGPNEIWSYGEEVEAILTAGLRLRERLRPYIVTQFRDAAATGAPIMRPLFLDFPEDRAAWLIHDQYMFGPDILVAPVLAAGVREREVYLPEGSVWQDPYSGREFAGGITVSAAAPLDRIPTFVRNHASHPIADVDAIGS